MAAFHRAHDRRYGYSDPGRPAEVVNVRARIIGVTEKPKLDRLRRLARNAKVPVVETRRAMFGGRAFQTRVYDRARLQRGNEFAGPAIVSEYSATTVIPPEWRGIVDSWGNLILTQKKAVEGKRAVRR